MTDCPKCGGFLGALDEDILDETEELQGETNAREFWCPYCNAHLRVFIKVDLVEPFKAEEEEES